MSFSIIDPNCQYMNLQKLFDFFKEESIKYFWKGSDDCNEYLNTTKDEKCVYFINADDIGLKHQYDFIAKTKTVEQFLVVLIGENRNEHFKKIALSNFSQNLYSIEKDVSVVYSDIKDVECIYETELKELEYKKSKVVLVTSARSFTGRKTTAELLSRLYPNKNFEACDSKEFEERSNHADHIIIVGCKETDFILPPPEKALNKTTIIVNKCDEAPVEFMNFSRNKKSILSVMANAGWKLPLEYDRFFIGSMLYDSFYKEYQDSDYGMLNSLRLNDNFYMWDEFGLPCSKSEYSDEKIVEFLARINVASNLF